MAIRVDRQDDMFGNSVPVFPNIPKWLKKPAEIIYQLAEKYGQRIPDEDQYLVYQFWMSEGLGDALGSEEAIQGFYEWFVAGNKPTEPETITRARRWLTDPRHSYIDVSNHVRMQRLRKQMEVQNQMRNDDG